MSKPFVWAMLALSLQILAIVILIPGNWTHKAVTSELALIESGLGEETANWVQDRASSWYVTAFIDTGIQEEAYRLLIPTAEQKRRSVGLENMGDWWFPLVEDRLNGLFATIYHLLIRVSLFVVWSPYMALIFAPALFDGWMMRSVKQTNFQYASPVVHRYGVRGVAFVVFAMVFAFTLPIALDPRIIPVALILVAICLGLIVSNMQKRI
ncbi:DUF4400 domain-containing protein [Pseudovibrio ascidiaceicola]|uniref:DUF4400 domain-containing protein n=1 Tax=Pseudovibrio ascidiaceicola TaxID=285279 RepID=UPI003D36B7CF